MNTKTYSRKRRRLAPREELRRAAKQVVALPDSAIAHRHLEVALNRYERHEQRAA